MALALLQVTADAGVSTKDMATILGLISVGSGLLAGAYKLGAFSNRVEAAEKNAVDAVHGIKGELEKIARHIADATSHRAELSGWRERHEQRVDDLDRRVTKLEP